MKYLLDTNTCIRYINGRALQIRVKMSTIPRSEVVVSSISKAEMFFGSAKSQTPERSLEKQIEFLETVGVLSFDDTAAHTYGPMRAELERNGVAIGQLDMLIAAIALANNLILVTHNVSEFSRINGLQIEDWEV